MLVYKYHTEIYPLGFHVVFDAVGMEWVEGYRLMNTSGVGVDDSDMEGEVEVIGGKIESSEMLTVGCIERGSGKRCVCCIVNSYDTSTWAHEACHVADFMCDYVGVKYGSFAEGEAHAYLVGWAMSKMMDAFYKYRKEEK